MQIKRFTKIVAFVTYLGFTFFSCIALFDLLVLLFVFLFCLLCQNALGVFRSCGSDEDAVPRPCKPLIKAKPVFAAAQTFLRKASRLDRNFKCFCAVTFVSFIGVCAMLRPRRNTILQLTANFKPPP